MQRQLNGRVLRAAVPAGLKMVAELASSQHFQAAAQAPLAAAANMQRRAKHGALSKRRAVKITGGAESDVPYWVGTQLEALRTAGCGADEQVPQMPKLAGFNNYANVANTSSLHGLLTAVGVAPEYATTLFQVRPLLGTMNPELVSFFAGQMVMDADKLVHVLMRVHPIFLRAPIDSSLRPKWLALRNWGFDAEGMTDAFCSSRKIMSVPGTEHMEHTLYTLQQLFDLSQDEAASVLERAPRIFDLSDAALQRRHSILTQAGLHAHDLSHAILTYPELTLGSNETLHAYFDTMARAGLPVARGYGKDVNGSAPTTTGVDSRST